MDEEYTRKFREVQKKYLPLWKPTPRQEGEGKIPDQSRKVNNLPNMLESQATQLSTSSTYDDLLKIRKKLMALSSKDVTDNKCNLPKSARSGDKEVSTVSSQEPALFQVRPKSPTVSAIEPRPTHEGSLNTQITEIDLTEINGDADYMEEETLKITKNNNSNKAKDELNQLIQSPESESEKGDLRDRLNTEQNISNTEKNTVYKTSREKIRICNFSKISEKKINPPLIDPSEFVMYEEPAKITEKKPTHDVTNQIITILTERDGDPTDNNYRNNKTFELNKLNENMCASQKSDKTSTEITGVEINLLDKSIPIREEPREDILQALENEISCESLTISNLEANTPAMHEPKLIKVGSAKEVVHNDRLPNKKIIPKIPSPPSFSDLAQPAKDEFSKNVYLYDIPIFSPEEKKSDGSSTPSNTASRPVSPITPAILLDRSDQEKRPCRSLGKSDELTKTSLPIDVFDSLDRTPSYVRSKPAAPIATTSSDSRSKELLALSHGRLDSPSTSSHYSKPVTTTVNHHSERRPDHSVTTGFSCSRSDHPISKGSAVSTSHPVRKISDTMPNQKTYGSDGVPEDPVLNRSLEHEIYQKRSSYRGSFNDAGRKQYDHERYYHNHQRKMRDHRGDHRNYWHPHSYFKRSGRYYSESSHRPKSSTRHIGHGGYKEHNDVRHSARKYSGYSNESRYDYYNEYEASKSKNDLDVKTKPANSSTKVYQTKDTSQLFFSHRKRSVSVVNRSVHKCNANAELAQLPKQSSEIIMDTKSQVKRASSVDRVIIGKEKRSFTDIKADLKQFQTKSQTKKSLQTSAGDSGLNNSTTRQCRKEGFHKWVQNTLKEPRLQKMQKEIVEPKTLQNYKIPKINQPDKVDELIHKPASSKLLSDAHKITGVKNCNSNLGIRKNDDHMNEDVEKGRGQKNKFCENYDDKLPNKVWEKSKQSCKDKAKTSGINKKMKRLVIFSDTEESDQETTTTISKENESNPDEDNTNVATSDLNGKRNDKDIDLTSNYDKNPKSCDETSKIDKHPSPDIITSFNVTSQLESKREGESTTVSDSTSQIQDEASLKEATKNSSSHGVDASAYNYNSGNSSSNNDVENFFSVLSNPSKLENLLSLVNNREDYVDTIKKTVKIINKALLVPPKYKTGPKSKTKPRTHDVMNLDENAKTENKENSSSSERVRSSSLWTTERLGECKTRLKRNRSTSPAISKKKKMESTLTKTSVNLKPSDCYTDKSYCFRKNTTIYPCRLCEYLGKDIVVHYKRKHPHSEIPLSRLDSEEARKAIKQYEYIQKYIQDMNVQIDTSNKYKCRFCYKTKNNGLNSFYKHIVRKHTGEYKKRCLCVDKLKCPHNNLHIPRFPNQEDSDGHLMGYICGKCNFTQISLKNLQTHVEVRHKNEYTKAYLINLSKYLESIQVENLYKQMYKRLDASKLRSKLKHRGRTQDVSKFHQRNKTNSDKLIINTKTERYRNKMRPDFNKMLGKSRDHYISDSSTSATAVNKEKELVKDRNVESIEMPSEPANVPCSIENLKIKPGKLETEKCSIEAATPLPSAEDIQTNNPSTNRGIVDVDKNPHFRIIKLNSEAREYVCCINGKESHFKHHLSISMKKHIKKEHAELWDGYCFICKTIVTEQGHKPNFEVCLQHYLDEHRDNIPIMESRESEGQSKEPVEESEHNPCINVRPLSELTPNDVPIEAETHLNISRIEKVIRLAAENAELTINSTRDIEQVTAPEYMTQLNYECRVAEVMSKKQQVVLDSMMTREKLMNLYKCAGRYCSFTSDSMEHSLAHASTHARVGGEASLSCAYCNFDCKEDPIDLVTHVFKSHGCCPFVCGLCFYRAAAAQLVAVHTVNKHPGMPIKVFTETMATLPEPRKYAELSREVVQHYVCPHHGCRYQTLNTNEFREHIRQCLHNETNHTCWICSTSAGSAAELVEHLKTHQLNVYQCTWCEHGEDHEAQLLAHAAAAHPDAPPRAYLRPSEGSDELRVLQLAFSKEIDVEKVPKKPASTVYQAAVAVREAERSIELEQLIQKIEAMPSSSGEAVLPKTLENETLSLSKETLKPRPSLVEIPSLPTLDPSRIEHSTSKSELSHHETVVKEQRTPSTAITETPIVETSEPLAVGYQIISLTDSSDEEDSMSSAEQIPIIINPSNSAVPENAITVVPITYQKIPKANLMKCPICRKTSKNGVGFKNHTISCFDDLMASVACAHCQLIRENRDDLVKHYVEDHCSQGSYICGVCKVSFFFKGDSKKHMKSVHGFVTNHVVQIDCGNGTFRLEPRSSIWNMPSLGETDQPAKKVTQIRIDDQLPGPSRQQSSPANSLSRRSSASEQLLATPISPHSGQPNEVTATPVNLHQVTGQVGSLSNPQSTQPIRERVTPPNSHLGQFTGHPTIPNTHMRPQGQLAALINSPSRWPYRQQLAPTNMKSSQPYTQQSEPMNAQPTPLEQLATLFSSSTRWPHGPPAPTDLSVRCSQQLATANFHEDRTSLQFPTPGNSPMGRQSVQQFPPSRSPSELQSLRLSSPVNSQLGPHALPQSVACFPYPARQSMHPTPSNSPSGSQSRQHPSPSYSPSGSQSRQHPSPSYSPCYSPSLQQLLPYSPPDPKSGPPYGLMAYDTAVLRYDFPQLVPDRYRLACGVQGCAILCVMEHDLQYHWNMCHSTATSFQCVHCREMIPVDATSAIFKILYHLRLHDVNLYACSSCQYCHYHEPTMEQHNLEIHGGKSSIIRVRKEVKIHNQPTYRDVEHWQCGLCEFTCFQRHDIIEHYCNRHQSIPQKRRGLFYYYYKPNTAVLDVDGEPRWMYQMRTGQENCGELAFHLQRL